MNLDEVKKIQAGKKSADVRPQSIADAYLKRVGKDVADVASRKGTVLIDREPQHLADIEGMLKAYHATDAGVSPLIATLSLMAGQRDDIPRDKLYDGLRDLRTRVQGTGYLKMYSPGNPHMAGELNELKELNTRLKSQRDLATTLAFYMGYYNDASASNWKDMLIGPAIGAMVGTGVAYGVQDVPELVAHVPMLPETGKTILTGAGVGTVYTVADIVDNGAAFVPQAASDLRKGVPFNKVVKRYGISAVSGALAGEFFNLGGGEIYTHWGLAGRVLGALIISVMTSLGIANEARKIQDANTKAYRQLLAEGRILPSEEILALQQRLKGASGSERWKLKQQLDELIDKYAEILGLVETTASLENRRATGALFLTPVYALIPDRSVQAGALGGSENWNLGVINGLSMMFGRTRLGYDQRMVRKYETGKEIDFMQLAGTPFAKATQHFANELGLIGQAPEKIQLLRNRGGEN